LRTHRVLPSFPTHALPISQMQSAIVFGLTAALYGEITFEKGRVKQSNFHDYPMLRMNEMPEVAVHIVASEERMGGVGEPGVPPRSEEHTSELQSLTNLVCR